MTATRELHPSWAAGWQRRLLRGDGGVRESILDVIAKLQLIIDATSRIHGALGNSPAQADTARIGKCIGQLRLDCQNRTPTGAELKMIVAALERFNLAHVPASAGGVPRDP